MPEHQFAERVAVALACPRDQLVVGHTDIRGEVGPNGWYVKGLTAEG